MSGYMKMTKLDFVTMKSQYWAYLSLLLIIALFWTMGSSVTLLCYTASWFIALFSQVVFSLQEKNKLDYLYGSVCINVKDIVLGRYIFTFLNFIVSLIAVLMLYFVTALFQNEGWQITDIAVGVSLSFLVVSIITGVQMPMYFKMGYTKARIWAMVPFMTVMFLMALFKPLTHLLSGTITFMQSHQGVLIIDGIVVGVIIQFISYRVSVAAYRRRR